MAACLTQPPWGNVSELIFTIIVIYSERQACDQPTPTCHCCGLCLHFCWQYTTRPYDNTPLTSCSTCQCDRKRWKRAEGCGGAGIRSLGPTLTLTCECSSSLRLVVGVTCKRQETPLQGNKRDWSRLIKRQRQCNRYEPWQKQRRCTTHRHLHPTPCGFEPLNRRKTWLQLSKYSFKGKTRTEWDVGAQEENGVGFYWNPCFSQIMPALLLPHSRSNVSPCTNGKTASL